MHKTMNLNWVMVGLQSDILFWDSDNSYSEIWLKDLKNKKIIEKRNDAHEKVCSFFQSTATKRIEAIYMKHCIIFQNV